jgi:hypothetical protein
MPHRDLSTVIRQKLDRSKQALQEVCDCYATSDAASLRQKFNPILERADGLTRQLDREGWFIAATQSINEANWGMTRQTRELLGEMKVAWLAALGRSGQRLRTSDVLRLEALEKALQAELDRTEANNARRFGDTGELLVHQHQAAQMIRSLTLDLEQYDKLGLTLEHLTEFCKARPRSSTIIVVILLSVLVVILAVPLLLTEG